MVLIQKFFLWLLAILYIKIFYISFFVPCLLFQPEQIDMIRGKMFNHEERERGQKVVHMLFLQINLLIRLKLPKRMHTKIWRWWNLSINFQISLNAFALSVYFWTQCNPLKFSIVYDIHLSFVTKWRAKNLNKFSSWTFQLIKIVCQSHTSQMPEGRWIH